MGKNTILVWLLTNEQLDAYACHFLGELTFFDGQIVICRNAATMYGPALLAFSSCVVHVVMAVVL